MEIEFKNSFIKETRKHGENLKASIEKVILSIKQAESIAEINNCKPMKGYKHYFRIRVGDFRIGIKVEENKVVLIRFLPRGDIYKHFP